MPNNRLIAFDLNADEVLERGVYYLPWIGTTGERYVVAVDHRGRRIVEATLFPTLSDHDAVLEMLWTILDREDPYLPHLSLLS